MENPESLAERLIRHYGGRRKAADALEVSGETLRLWKRDGIPLQVALDLEQRCKGVVTAEEILHAARASLSTPEPARAA